MKKICLLTIAWALLMLPVCAQNIAINTDASKPDANAILDIKSGNKGLLIPRMSTEARNRIPNTKGLLVYDNTTDNFWYNTGKEWKCIPNDDDRGKNGNAWLISGNSNTKDGVNFLGTTNNVPLNIRVNNQPSGRIDSTNGNAFWGYRAGGSDSGISNTAIGDFALTTNTTGEYNAASGFQALFLNTSGGANEANGALSLRNNTTGRDNAANGYFSMGSNISGSYNEASGYSSLYSNISGDANTANGYGAMIANTTGTVNTADGYVSMAGNTSGICNTATGAYAMFANTTGSSNVANGFGTMFHSTTGIDNTAVGDSALVSNIGGSNITAIGYLADVSNPYLGNATAIGSGAIVDASNKVRIGNSAVTVIEGQVPFTTPSDGRYKFNVQEDVKGLDFILHLRPVTYQFDVKGFDAHLRHQPGKEGGPVNYALQAGYDVASRIRRTGFIAQEVEQAANASGYDFSGIIRPATEQDHYSLSYDAFVVPLVKAVQEQQKIILQQNKKLDEQDKKLISLQEQIDEIKKLLQHAN
jgi:hypothetical protein